VVHRRGADCDRRNTRRRHRTICSGLGWTRSSTRGAVRPPAWLGHQIRSQQQRQRGGVYRQRHAAARYEFGVKAPIVTNNRRAPGGLFVLHAQALSDRAGLCRQGIPRPHAQNRRRASPRARSVASSVSSHLVQAAPPLLHQAHHRTPEG
jgi:hypothetical protein